MTREIFVFGSNEAGRHGAGAAHFALQHHGAVYGQGEGMQGDSYGIPTKDRALRTLPLRRILTYTRTFVDFAEAHPELVFRITRIGCGLAGYEDEDIAPMFQGAPANCLFFDRRWPVLAKSVPLSRLLRLYG